MNDIVEYGAAIQALSEARLNIKVLQSEIHECRKSCAEKAAEIARRDNIICEMSDETVNYKADVVLKDAVIRLMADILSSRFCIHPYGKSACLAYDNNIDCQQCFIDHFTKQARELKDGED